MNKLLWFMISIFIIPILSVVGKTIYDAVTENYTFANTVSNLTLWPWLVPYSRLMWWLIPIAAVIFLILFIMKKQEPQPPTFTMPRQPRQPKQPKQPPPPMFIKR